MTPPGEKRKTLQIFYFRHIDFNEIVENVKLVNGSTLAQMRVKTREQCSFICTKTAECRSFNLCLFGLNFLCELNRNEINMAWSIIESQEKCQYVGMQRDSIPRCKEGSLEINITDDQNSQNCSINLKRIDQSFDYESRINDTATDWMRYTAKICTNHGAHQVDTICTESAIVHEHYKWVTEKTGVREAMQNCKDLGGQLFGDFNGSRDQVWFLAEKMGFNDFWVGINDVEQDGTFRTLRGNLTSQVPWFDKEPSNFAGENYVAMFATALDTAMKSNVRVVSDTENPSRPLGSVCQMLYAEWGAWEFTFTEQVVISDPIATMVDVHKYTRECVTSYYTVDANCGGENQKFESYELSTGPLNYTEAEAFCISIGARLFSDLDGTHEQLHMLSQITQFKYFWIGISQQVEPGTFRNLKGENVTDLLFAGADIESEVSQIGQTDYAFYVNGPIYEFSVTPDSPTTVVDGQTSQHIAMCDMFYSEWGQWGSVGGDDSDVTHESFDEDGYKRYKGCISYSSQKYNL